MRKYLIGVVAGGLLCLSGPSRAQHADKSLAPPIVDTIPAYCTALHNVGKIEVPVTNFGVLVGALSETDCLTGESVVDGCEYPKGSHVSLTSSCALWVGAVVGRDTLVSTGTVAWGAGNWEMSPDISPFGDFEVRSLSYPMTAAIAVSEQDFICTYTDTQDLVYLPSVDELDLRPHIPLMLKVTQRSYAWSYEYAEDFVLFDISLKNFGNAVWEDMYLALCAVMGANAGGGMWDEVVGFRRAAPSWLGCGYEDTVNLAWAADNDGDPFDGEWVEPVRPVKPPAIGYEGSARPAIGLRILQAPSEHLPLSYNWWLSHPDPEMDWGPRHKSDTRSFMHDGSGTPMGDRMRYHIMSNHEFDPPQIEVVSIKPSDPLWQAPMPDMAPVYAKGGNASTLLSYGAFTRIEPGEEISIAFAVIGGEHFHNDPGNGANLPYSPRKWYANVDFSDLVKNAMWAGWIYDNPGVDTDGDGYYGDYRICVFDSVQTDSGWIATAAETTWYRGDGVPDWRGAAPPPAPYVYIEPTYQGFRIRFNGERSETEKDLFFHQVDFEGYRIYLGRDEREASLSLIESYDRYNFDKYVWNNQKLPDPGWQLRDIPYTLDSLRCLYGRGDDPCADSMFNPLLYTPLSWYTHPKYPDSIMYFTVHDYNRCEYPYTTRIHKVYPDEPDPRTLPLDSLTPARYTAEGHYKYFEYECVIDGLLPTVPYWINVTAFDCGSPNSGLDALETSKTQGLQQAYAAGSEAQAAGADDRVWVYPNPYRIDGDYRDRGLEGRDRGYRPEFRTREVHFANIPPVCTIRIHTLDGDLVKEIRHSASATDPAGRHESWDMITRNRQLLVTGLYYWTVESSDGRVQIGKLAVIQ